MKRIRREVDVKEMDLEIAVQIAGYAGLNVRDRKGNLSSDVWVRHSDKMSIGHLIEASDLKQILMNHLELQLNSQKELVKQLDDDKVVVDWVLHFVQTWEDAYKLKVNKNFDISQSILSCMHETVHEIKDALEYVGLGRDYMKKCIDSLREMHDDELLNTDEAIVRFLFRNEYTGSIFRRVAGKVLQKNIVCNKAGTYSARVQRNDITQDRAMAFRDILLFLESEEKSIAQTIALLKSKNLLPYVQNSLKIQAECLYDDPAHITRPPPSPSTSTLTSTP